jgi:anti-sigma regulatory factor (Ser/Thr protein kinase)
MGLDKYISVPLGASFHEDVVWSEHILPTLAHLPENVLRICEYGFTEMANNANDHSGAPEVYLAVEIQDQVTLWVLDRGIGIFRNIYQKLHLDDMRHAIFELHKGKLTTDPDRHTGEGIFFASRMFDVFSIVSEGLMFSHDWKRDWLLSYNQKEPSAGTVVQMVIDIGSPRKIADVFNQYAADQNDFGFNKTTVAIRLAQNAGESLVSRSQAKRVLTRLDKFREVVFDFDGVTSISPSFADEIFRVFKNSHPGIVILPARASDEVAKMISKAMAEAEKK